MKTINNINYTLDNGCGIEFIFNYKGENTTAYLQLPNTPDSQHQIDGEDFDCDDERHNEIYEALKNYFYNDFKDSMCAKASVFLGKRIVDVKNVNFNHEHYDDDGAKIVNRMTIYVAFDEDNEPYFLKEGYASDYYNVFYFEEIDIYFSDEEHEQILELAKQ